LKNSVAQERVSEVASVPIPGGRSLHPVKNRGSFDKAVDQNSPPIFYFLPTFHWANYTLNKTPPYFLFPSLLFFLKSTFNKTSS